MRYDYNKEWDEFEIIHYLETCLNSFFTAKVPENADLTMAVMAKWGKKRLEDMGKINSI